MPHVVSDGLTLVQSTGARVRDGVGTVASGLRDELDAVRQHGEKTAAHARRNPVWRARMVELAASAAGAAAAFLVSRLVRALLHGQGTLLRGQSTHLHGHSTPFHGQGK